MQVRESKGSHVWRISASFLKGFASLAIKKTTKD
jgi:hypothetical protein